MPFNKLWIVATPIGNPDDLSPRGQAVLREADLILAEDTRRANQLLAKMGIKPKRMLSFFEHNEDARQKEVIDALESGQTVALMTDAGTPTLADPGYRLIRECRKLKIPVSPVPGPSAPVAALSAAGLPPVPFTFIGFLPRSRSSRIALFQSYALLPGSLIFFERKNRLEESLELARQILGEREIAICRELTKIHEEFIIGFLSQASGLANNLLGEITVIIGPASTIIRLDETEVERLLIKALATGLKPREAAREVKKMAHGWSVADLYALIQSLKEI